MRITRQELDRIIADAERLESFEESIEIGAPPVSVRDILDFFDVPGGAAFDLPPEQAIAYFKAKGLQPTFHYADMLNEAHDQAFTVAKMMDLDMLAQVRASLDSALANGQPFKQWANSIAPILQSGGWWGRQAVIDPLTGQTVVAQLGSPWRLETIFRTNMQSAYAAGAWQQIDDQKNLAPYLLYDAIDDYRTRPLHKAWDNTVLPVDSPWWQTHYPPNGYNCRCGVIQLSAEELADLGMQPNTKPPDAGTYDWTNPRTGQTIKVPNGLDPGFAHNSGKSWKTTLEKLHKEKIGALEADMAAAAAQAAQKAKLLSDEAIAAAKAIAVSEGQAQLARAKALIAEKIKQQTAADLVAIIAKGDQKAIGKSAAYKVKALAQLKKGATWAELKPTEQLTEIEKLAGEFKLKVETGSKLTNYKKAILAGKTPAPAYVNAFNSLSPAEQSAYLAKIDLEKAALELKKAEAAAKAAKAAAPADVTPSPAIVAPEALPPNPATMTKIGRKTKGATEGAFYQDTATGQKYLVKWNGSEDAVLNEVLAGRLYNLAGVEAPELHYLTIEGKPALVSKIIDGISEVDAATLARTAAVQEGFAVDAWLANWDSIGLNYDNTVLVGGGRALRIDVGGSLRYRAMGGLKGKAWGNTVGELETLIDGTNPQAAAVFGNITRAQLERGVEKVLATADDDILALVERYGPRDAVERRALADTLLARKRDLARRFPAVAERVQGTKIAAEAPPPKPARVTPQEQAFIDDARVNGYALPSDKDQIEDHMVLVSRFARKDGSEATLGWLKIREPAAREMLASAIQDGGQVVEIASARQRILESVKSINLRAAKGQAIEESKLDTLRVAIAEIRGKAAELKIAAGKATSPDALLKTARDLDNWALVIEHTVQATPAGTIPKAIGMFDTASIPSDLAWSSATQGKAPALTWRRIKGRYEYQLSTFDRSFAKQTGRVERLPTVDLRYEADLPDGTKLTFFPHHDSVGYAMQGFMRVEVAGGGIESTERLLAAIGEAGINVERADELARRHLYLNAVARLHLTQTAKGRVTSQTIKAFKAITGNDQAALDQKLQVLNKALGLQIEKSEGWAAVDGVRQAFGHGRAYQLRPDFTVADMQELGRTHVIYHNPQGLGRDAGTGVFEKLKPVIDGGGVVASAADRVRRGVPLNGSSIEADLESGGGDYVFTRIRARDGQKGTGVYWKVNQLRRMDAISYAGDNFGRTTGSHIDEHRYGQTVDSIKSLAHNTSNETIFKGGLSLFDDIDRIVLSTPAEVKDAIGWMQQRGYRAWPDGRKLDEVIISKAKHLASIQ